MSNLFKQAFTKPSEHPTVEVTAAEWEQMQAELEYYKNRVRQLEERAYLVERGKDKQGEIIWGTPSRGLDVESLRREEA